MCLYTYATYGEFSSELSEQYGNGHIPPDVIIIPRQYWHIEVARLTCRQRDFTQYHVKCEGLLNDSVQPRVCGLIHMFS